MQLARRVISIHAVWHWLLAELFTFCGTFAGAVIHQNKILRTED
jgi:hypothetical protein